MKLSRWESLVSLTSYNDFNFCSKGRECTNNAQFRKRARNDGAIFSSALSQDISFSYKMKRSFNENNTLAFDAENPRTELAIESPLAPQFHQICIEMGESTNGSKAHTNKAFMS